MAKPFKKITNEVRQFIYTKFYGMNEDNTLTFEELLEKTAKLSMDQRVINNGRTEGYATSVTVVDPESKQSASTDSSVSSASSDQSADSATSTAGEEKSPVAKFNEQKMISGNSSFFITVRGTELPEEVYSLTAAQSELQYAQSQGVKFFKHVDKDGVAQFYRAGKVKVKVDEKFGEVGPSVYEKLSWPKGMTADALGKQRPILVKRDVRENMPEGIYGSLELARTNPNLVPIITTALTLGLAASMLIGGPVQNPDKPTPDDTTPQDQIVTTIDKTEEDDLIQDKPVEDPPIIQDDQVVDQPVVNEKSNIALGNVFKLEEGVKAFYTAKEAMDGQNAQGNGVAVIGNQYCSPDDNYYIDGFAVLDQNGNVVDTNFKTYGLTREEYVNAVAAEKGLNPEDLKGIVHYSKVGEGVKLNENGDMVYDGSTNTGWVDQTTVTEGENTFLEGAEMQGSLEALDMLKNPQNLPGQAVAGGEVEFGQ